MFFSICGHLILLLRQVVFFYYGHFLTDVCGFCRQFSGYHAFQVHGKINIFNKNILNVSRAATSSFQILGGDCNLFKITWHVFLCHFPIFTRPDRSQQFLLFNVRESFPPMLVLNRISNYFISESEVIAI